jgi:NTP pyrophosphatase (non-canonical NTP hydrolase)
MTTPHEPNSTTSNSPALSLTDFQKLIEKMYGAKDRERGIEGTFMWFMEEVGELATALREGRKEELEGEFADVVAWLTTIANVANIDLTQAIHKKYGTGCPGCQQLVCICPPEEKP